VKSQFSPEYMALYVYGMHVLHSIHPLFFTLMICPGEHEIFGHGEHITENDPEMITESKK